MAIDLCQDIPFNGSGLVAEPVSSVRVRRRLSSCATRPVGDTHRPDFCLSEELVMRFHVFTNSSDPNLYALTADPEGEALPVDHPEANSRWNYWKSFEGKLEGRIAFALKDETAAEAEIEKHGYYLFQRKAIPYYY